MVVDYHADHAVAVTPLFPKRCFGPRPITVVTAPHYIGSVSDPELDEVGRPKPPFAGSELATDVGYLEFQRATLEWKCRGLSDEQLRVSIRPSTVTLGGLLKHLALVEDFWFTEVAGESPLPEPWASADTDSDPDWEWHSAADDTGDEIRTLWATCVERSRDVVDALVRDGGAEALSATHPAWGGQAQVSLRSVIVHMIEEYARHNGHADLLREAIDGETGE